ncbi:MAG: hypothetical protein ACTSU2_05795 [Promethearchaeota archaeon]
MSAPGTPAPERTRKTRKIAHHNIGKAGRGEGVLRSSRGKLKNIGVFYDITSLKKA